MTFSCQKLSQTGECTFKKQSSKKLNFSVLSNFVKIQTIVEKKQSNHYCTFLVSLYLRRYKHSSWWRRLEDVFRLRFLEACSRGLQDVLIKKNIFSLVKRLQKKSWWCLDQDKYIRLGHKSSGRLQDVFKTSSRRLAKASSRQVQNIFKMFEVIFKTFSQDVLKTSCKDVFKTFSRRTISLNCFSRSHFWEIFGQCRKFAKVITFLKF